MRRTTLTLTSTGLIGSMTAAALVVAACGGSDPPPNTAASAYPPNGQYPPQQGYPQQGGYPQQPQQYPQQPQQYPQQPAQPPPAAGGAMATPGPLALPCQADSACGLHHCNTQYGKCAFPCAGPADCMQGNNCMMGVCAPGMPGQ